MKYTPFTPANSMKKEGYTVQFSGEGAVPVAEGKSLLEASIVEGIPLMHLCGGLARCSTCRVLVLEGAAALAPPTEPERRLKERMLFPLNVRLACQTRVKGDGAKVVRILRNESDINLYVGTEAGHATQQIGQEMELVMFFLDIRNFTFFVETHLAFDVIHIVRKLFIAFHAIIDGHGGRVIETAGDGMYAVFGLRTGLAPGAKAALEAGYAILAELERLNDTYFKEYFCQTVAIGIGIHAGKAIKGNIRLGHDNHMVVMGHAVNIAARLQNATKELNNSFIISDAVYQLLPTPPAQFRKTSVALRGVSGPLRVYLLGEPYSETILARRPEP
jgi:adenylate cyclase